MKDELEHAQRRNARPSPPSDTAYVINAGPPPWVVMIGLLCWFALFMTAIYLIMWR